MITIAWTREDVAIAHATMMGQIGALEFLLQHEKDIHERGRLVSEINARIAVLDKLKDAVQHQMDAASAAREG